MISIKADLLKWQIAMWITLMIAVLVGKSFDVDSRTLILVGKE